MGLVTILKIVTLTLSPWHLWPCLKLPLKGVGERKEPLINALIEGSPCPSWMMTLVLIINGYGSQMSKGTSIQGAPWTSYKVRLTRACWTDFGEYGFTRIEYWEIQWKWLWRKWNKLTRASIAMGCFKSSMLWSNEMVSLLANTQWDSTWLLEKSGLQSHEALGSTKEERIRLLVDHLLQSMNPKLQARVTHVVDGKDPCDRPSYYKLVKFAIQKEAEINFDEAKKTQDSNSKPKATTHFHYECWKSTLPATLAVCIIALAPGEEDGEEEFTPHSSKDSDSVESYEAFLEDSAVSAGDIEVAIWVVCTAETFSGRCFRCNKVGHRFSDKECKCMIPSF